MANLNGTVIRVVGSGSSVNVVQAPSQRGFVVLQHGFNGMSEAPQDGLKYARQDKLWIQLTDLDEAPIDGTAYVRVNGLWALADYRSSTDYKNDLLVIKNAIESGDTTALVALIDSL